MPHHCGSSSLRQEDSEGSRQRRAALWSRFYQWKKSGNFSNWDSFHFFFPYTISSSIMESTMTVPFQKNREWPKNRMFRVQ